MIFKGFGDAQIVNKVTLGFFNAPPTGGGDQAVAVGIGWVEHIVGMVGVTVTIACGTGCICTGLGKCIGIFRAG